MYRNTEDFVFVPVDKNTCRTETDVIYSKVEISIFKAITNSEGHIIEDHVVCKKNLYDYFAAALRVGNVEIVEILYKKLKIYEFNNNVAELNQKISIYALESAKWGHIEVLNWFNEKNTIFMGLYITAASRGQIKVLDWALKKNIHCGNYERESLYDIAARVHNAEDWIKNNKVKEWIKLNKFSMFN